MPIVPSSASNFSLSSARSMPSAEVPSILTPRETRKFASEMAVCPPNATTTPMGFSTSRTPMTSSGQSGSK